MASLYLIGSVVRLKSGGASMTVSAIDGTMVELVWTGRDGGFQRERVPCDCLQSSSGEFDGAVDTVVGGTTHSSENIVALHGNGTNAQG